MNKIAIFFDTSCDYDKAKLFVDNVISYISLYEMEVDVINIVSSESINIIFPDTDIVKQVTGEIDYCIANYNYIFAVGTDSAIEMINDVVDKFNYLHEEEDNITISSIRGQLFEGYVKDALVVKNDSESINRFIDEYLDSLLNTTNEKEIAEIKKGLTILKNKLYE